VPDSQPEIAAARARVTSLPDKDVRALGDPRPTLFLRALLRVRQLHLAYPSVSTDFFVGWAAVEGRRRGVIDEDGYQSTIRALARNHIVESDLHDAVEEAGSDA
jgi:hypothetical protein